MNLKLIISLIRKIHHNNTKNKKVSVFIKSDRLIGEVSGKNQFYYIYPDYAINT